jgi:hypothetical protein
MHAHVLSGKCPVKVFTGQAEENSPLTVAGAAADLTLPDVSSLIAGDNGRTAFPLSFRTSVMPVGMAAQQLKEPRYVKCASGFFCCQ